MSCPLRIIFGTILKVDEEQIDQKIRKFMMMQKALHPTDDVDRLCVSRKERGKGLANIQDSVDALIQ